MITKSEYILYMLEILSYVLPKGEKFMVRVTEQFLVDIRDKSLKADVEKFVLEEKNHFKVHDKYNSDVNQTRPFHATMENTLSKILNDRSKSTSNLAIVAGFEYTATSLSRIILNDEERWLGHVPKRLRAVYKYHCKEEIGHKHVVFDLVQHLDINKTSYTLYALFAFLAFFWVSNKLIIQYKGWKVFFKGLFFHIGDIWKVLKYFLLHFKKGYHPNLTDDTHLL